MADSSEHEQSRSDKLQALIALGVDPWGQRFDGHQSVAEVLSLPIDAEKPAPAKIAGRVVLRRDMGKVHFLQVRDWTGTVQVMLGQKQVGPQAWEVAKLVDLGDVIGIEGTFGKTRTGELTVFCTSLTYLTKSLQPHPDKHHGMADMEFRLRHRYLDLIYNEETLTRARQRILLMRTIREHLNALGYWEVETPTLHSIAGGAAARPFTTHHNALDIDLFVRIALELHLKRLLIGGIEKVYEIGRVFRNEGISPRHNPEFTMMELYQAYGNYETMMTLTEGLIVACVAALGDSMQRPYGEHVVDYTPPFQRVKYADLFREHVGCEMLDRDAVRTAAGTHRVALELKNATTGTSVAKEHDVLVHELFEHCCEQHLIGPVFVHDYPAALCPLTKRKREQPEIAERFELYVRGMELANAYTELNDPITQEETFRRQLTGMNEDDSMAKMDHEFIEAQRHGMPPAGGLGIGIDRLCMLLTNTTTIRDVILFPLLRPQG